MSVSVTELTKSRSTSETPISSRSSPARDGSRDCCLLEAGGEPGIYLAALDLDRLRRYREREVFGNAYRRPGVYRALAEEAVRPPFVRGDARR